VAALPPARARSPDRVREASFLAWSGVHGAAMLVLDGACVGTVLEGSDEVALERLIVSVTESLAADIAGRSGD